MPRKKPKKFRVYAEGNPNPFAKGLSEEEASAMIRKYKRLGILLRKIEE